MSDSDTIIGVATIVVLGVGAQWIGRRLGFPSLLLLLPAGVIAGDVTDLVDPEALLGDSLFPTVTVLVALLLFQSGLDLRLDDLPRHARGPVIRLVTVGAALTAVGASLAVRTILGVSAGLACIVGAILVVSGPTVVGPLLEVIRPREPTGGVLRWEGTVLDPVGATLGVVLLNLVLASERDELHPIVEMLSRFGLGVGVGLAAAVLFLLVMSRFLVTDNMEAAAALMFAVAAFAGAEVLLSEAGLFATVTFGVVAANQRIVPTARISGFGETLDVLIIGALFILLGALVELEAVRELAWDIVLLTAVLVVVVRPVSVAVALARTSLPARDRVLIGWVDPRGIVAAATAAQFSGTLADSGYNSDFIQPVVFGVILGTGIVYGLSAKPVARLLGIAEPRPTGVALVGDEPWMFAFANRLGAAGASVLVVTSEPGEAMGDPRVQVLSILERERQVAEVVEETPLAKVVVATEPGAAMTLVVAELVERVGRRNVHHVPHHRVDAVERAIAWGRPAFDADVTLADLNARVDAGGTIEVVEHIDDDVTVLAVVRNDGRVHFGPRAGQLDGEITIIALVGGAPSAS